MNTLYTIEINRARNTKRREKGLTAEGVNARDALRKALGSRIDWASLTVVESTYWRIVYAGMIDNQVCTIIVK